MNLKTKIDEDERILVDAKGIMIWDQKRTRGKELFFLHK